MALPFFYDKNGGNRGNFSENSPNDFRIVWLHGSQKTTSRWRPWCPPWSIPGRPKRRWKNSRSRLQKRKPKRRSKPTAVLWEFWQFARENHNFIILMGESKRTPSFPDLLTALNCVANPSIFSFLTGHQVRSRTWLQPFLTSNSKWLSGWWFQIFFIFHHIWDNPSHWLIFFKMVKTC